MIIFLFLQSVRTFIINKNNSEIYDLFDTEIKHKVIRSVNSTEIKSSSDKSTEVLGTDSSKKNWWQITNNDIISILIMAFVPLFIGFITIGLLFWLICRGQHNPRSDTNRGLVVKDNGDRQQVKHSVIGETVKSNNGMIEKSKSKTSCINQIK